MQICCAAHVGSWHFCDMPGRAANVRYWGADSTGQRNTF
jgi:hypothetical protein